MSEYNFTLPYPPSVNGYWRNFNGRQIISKRGRDYVEAVKSEMRSINLIGELISSRMHVSIKINPPSLRKYDVDNFAKGVFDSLTKCGFWVDDEQVDKLTIEKGEKIKGGNVEVSVYLK